MVSNWLAELDGRRVTVEVPASSANLGAGYDCLALALDLVNRIDLEVRGWSRGAIELEIDGEGANELTDDRHNRFVQGLEAALVAVRGAPTHIRCDNGPEMTAHALRDWCRFSKTGSAYIEPGSPWQNPYVESFGGRVRDELLAVELFSCLTEAQMLIEDWRQDYNHHRPHSALGMMAPAAFAAGLRQPPRLPTATTSGEGGEQRYRLPVADSAPQPTVFPAPQPQNPAEEITSLQANRRGGYRASTTTSTQLSQQVDR